MSKNSLSVVRKLKFLGANPPMYTHYLSFKYVFFDCLGSRDQVEEVLAFVEREA